MDADNFIWINCFYYFLDSCSVCMTRGMYVNDIVKHISHFFVFRVCLNLFRNLVVTIPRRVDKESFFLWQFLNEFPNSFYL